MSTKTTLKRVALVAVSALGFGLLSVFPAKAAEGDATEVTAVTVADASGRLGNPITSQVGFTSSSLEATEEVTIRARFDTRPAGSSATVAFNNTGLDLVGATGDTAVFTSANGSGNELLPARLVVDSTATAYTDGNHVAGRVGFLADVLGDYTMTIWHDANNDGLVGATESVDTATFTVAAAPASVSISAVNSTTSTTGTNGALVKLSLLTSAGSAAGLTSAESLTIDPSGAEADIAIAGDAVADTSANGAAATATSADFVGGVLWLNISNNGGTAGAVTVSLAGVGGEVTGLSGTFTITFVDIDNAWTGTWSAGTSGSRAYGATIGTATVDGANDRTIPVGASTLTYTFTSTADLAAEAYTRVTVTDTNGRVTGSRLQGKTGLAYDLAVQNTGTAAAGTGSFSVSITTSAIDQSYKLSNNAQLTIDDVVSDTLDVEGGTVSASPALITATPAGSVSIVARAQDQFVRSCSICTITMTIAGRNATTAATAQTKSLDSTGRATFTITDAPAAGVTATTDTVTFTATDPLGNSKTGTASITWSAAAVGTITLTGGNTTAGVTATTPTLRDIAAGTSGAQANTYSFTATVKDASGNLLAGIPVAWTISGTGAAVLSTSATTYTTAAGVATGTVYGWIAGTYTVTATAGGKTGTGTITFAQTAAGEERTLSATVSGPVVTATVVDRFGNPVPGVAVYATNTGAGYFGSGTTRTNSTTGADGKADFIITGGDASVTLYTYNPTVSGAKGSGQTCSRAGTASCGDTAADDTALTATTVGTATTAETGVGASFAPAGVSTVTVAVTGVNTAQAAAEAASDAAAEAIDAANAATDAANLAAEAADAATVAAEEARDAADAATAAVEELATQVATLMAALKAQITTLANTVAKIAKKVKA